MLKTIVLVYTLSTIALFEYSAYFYTKVTSENKDLKTLITNADIKYKSVVLAQTLLETGYYTSKVYKENNNPFGMKHNKRGYSKGTKNNHAYYASLEHAVQDYKEWQLKYCPANISTDEEYLAWLDKWGYAEDPSYTTKLRKIIQTMNNG